MCLQGPLPLDSLLLLDDAEGHVVVRIGTQCRRIRHWPVHDPPLELIFGPYKVLDLGLGGHVAGCQLRLPVLVGSRVAPVQDALELFVGPGIEVDGLDLADVDSHATVNARAADADEDA
jgi:hypothetical protein